AAEVVDSDRVCAAEGVKIHALDAVGIHRDAALLAEESQPGAIGREVDVLVGSVAVEDHRIESILPLDDVAPLARIPDERVVARAERSRVIAAATADKIVSLAADQRVGI